MESLHNTILSNLQHCSSQIGVFYDIRDSAPYDLLNDELIIFQLPFYGHYTGSLCLSMKDSTFEKYHKAIGDNDKYITHSFFFEILNMAFSQDSHAYEEMKNVTIGLPRSFRSPFYESGINCINTNLQDKNIKDHVTFSLYFDQRKTELGVQLDAVKEEHEKIQSDMEQQNRTFENQKFEAIGQLASGVAHEINTPIQFVCDNLDFLKTCFEEVIENINDLSKIDLPYYKEEVPLSITESIDGMKRISDIVCSLKEISHSGKSILQKANPEKLLSNCLALTKSTWKHCAKIETHIEQNLEFKAYLNELSQVLINLVVNSSHSIKDKHGNSMNGRISIKLYREDSGVYLEVADNGGGIPDKVATKIYNPFFTTKEIGKGTGQGLAISKAIIERKHKGKIELAQNSVDGVTFKIYIPEDL